MEWLRILLFVLAGIIVAYLLIDTFTALAIYFVLRKKGSQSQLAYEKMKKDLDIATSSNVEFVVNPNRFTQMLSSAFRHNGFPRYRIVLLFLRLKAIFRLYKKEKILQTGAAAASLTLCGDLSMQIGDLRNGGVMKPSLIRTDVALAGLQVVRLYMTGYSKTETFAASRFESALRVDNALNGSFYKYRCQDGNYFSAHVYYESQKAKFMAALSLQAKPEEFTLDSLKKDRKSVAQCLEEYNSYDLEKLAFDCGACGCVLRSRDEWEKTDFGSAVRAMPLVRTTKLVDSPKKDYGQCRGALPLTGIKFLDLTHIIAGPACSRILAEYGADVLLVRRGKFDSQEQAMLELDGWAGKNSIQLDFNDSHQLETCKELVKKADVIIYSYQNGALDHFGLSREDMHKLNPNLIYGSLMCFSDTVWKDKPGWAPLAEDVTGLSIRNGSRAKPKNLNGVPLDYIPGFILAVGVLNAIKKNLTEGGSYDVTASLTRTAQWLHEVSDLNEQKVELPTLTKVVRGDAPIWKKPVQEIEPTAVGPIFFPVPATYIETLPSQFDAMRFNDGNVDWRGF